MFMFTRYVFLLTSLLSSVSALPLASRDVVDPPITSPTASTIWHVGQMQTVTWNTTNLPVNQTNPVGKLVLGYWYNNSEHLMLNSPLATNLNYSVGQAQVTVPDVPTRSDYIVVLFGDSGNASPQFTIINDASSSTSMVPSPVTSSTTSPPGSTPPGSTPPPGSPPPATPAPANLNPASSGDSSPTHVTGSQATATAPASQTSSHTSTTSTTVVVTASSRPSSTSSAVWQKHVPGLGTSLSVALALIYFALS